jgi:hypothetical protein
MKVLVVVWTGDEDVTMLVSMDHLGVDGWVVS